MKIEINPKQKIIVILEAQEYVLTKPTLGMQEDYEERLSVAKESGKGGIKVMIQFIAECGLPSEVVRKLDADELDAVMKALTPAKKN